MGTGLTLEIPYDNVVLLVMGLFMFVGATRGWRQEFISSCVLLLLTAILFQPELAAPIVDYISNIIRLILAFLQGLGRLDFGALEARYRGIEMPFSGDNPYMMLVAVLVGFVLITYGMRGSAKGLTPFSRIMGGLLGLFNGFLIVSLFKEYILRYFQKASPALWAAAGASPEPSVTLRGLPVGGVLAGGVPSLVSVLVVLLVVLLVITTLTSMRQRRKKKSTG
jgi:uncharacterized membrane protein required for colicin V production